MPAHEARNPIQLTDVPENVNVAVAPAERLKVAVPWLHPRLLLPWNQSGGWPGPSVPGVYTIERSVSSKRVAAGGGTALETVTVTAETGEQTEKPVIVLYEVRP